MYIIAMLAIIRVILLCEVEHFLGNSNALVAAQLSESFRALWQYLESLGLEVDHELEFLRHLVQKVVHLHVLEFSEAVSSDMIRVRGRRFALVVLGRKFAGTLELLRREYNRLERLLSFHLGEDA